MHSRLLPALLLNELREFLRVLWWLVAHLGLRFDFLVSVFSFVTASLGGGAGGVPTKTNEVPYSRSASSLVSFRKVTLPIFLTSAMGVFEARRRAAGKGVESHSALLSASY
jgi:hypothetical protein